MNLYLAAPLLGGASLHYQLLATITLLTKMQPKNLTCFIILFEERNLICHDLYSCVGMRTIHTEIKLFIK